MEHAELECAAPRATHWQRKNHEMCRKIIMWVALLPYVHQPNFVSVLLFVYLHWTAKWI